MSSYVSSSDMNRIIFKEIKGFDEYGIGQYADFEVVIMKENGYINAPKMLNMIAKILDKKNVKLFADWKRIGPTQELLAELSLAMGQPIAKLIIEVKSIKGNEEISGTYIHPDLVPALAAWASPKFGLRVARIVNAFFVNDFKEKLIEKERKINQQSNKIGKQKDTIAELKENMKKMMADQAKNEEKRQKDAEKAEEKRQKDADTRDRQYRTMMENVDESKEETKKAHATVRKIANEVIPKVAKDRVPEERVPTCKLERCAIIRNHVVNPRREWMYYIMCGQQTYINTKINNYLHENDGSEVAMIIQYQANSKNLLHRIKTIMQHRNNNINSSGNNIDLLEDYTHEDFIEAIRLIDQDKYNVDLKGIVIV